MVSKKVLFPSQLYKRYKGRLVKFVLNEHTHFGIVIGYNMTPNSNYKLIVGIMDVKWRDKFMTVRQMKEYFSRRNRKNPNFVVNKPWNLYPHIMSCKISEVTDKYVPKHLSGNKVSV